MTAPPMAYYGGKTRIAAKIASLLPQHEHYVEPFAGSLAVLLAKKPSRMETVNDIDEKLMTLWRVLRNKPLELIRECALTPHSRAEYFGAREVGDWSRLDIPTMTGQGRTNLARTEVIWSNRPLNSQRSFDFDAEGA